MHLAEAWGAMSCEGGEMSGEAVREFWDAQAATFDDEPDHGLSDDATKLAWTALLDDLLGDSLGDVVDLGCGTGSISSLLTRRGHRVLGIDLSPKMIERARAKAELEGLDIEFVVGDVQHEPVPERELGVVLSRHVLWAVSDPGAVVSRWSAPLADDGIFIAIEGVWNGAGVPADAAVSILESQFRDVVHIDLADRPVLWGKEVDDHRYVVVGRGRDESARC